MRYRVTPLHRLFFPSVIWQTESDSTHLTFDDGPHPIATPAVLDVLRKHNIKCTFFLIGKNAVAHPDLVSQIVSEGHQIGNHTYNHRNLIFRSKAMVRAEIRDGKDAIEKIVGNRIAFFRPPYGYFDYRTISLAKGQGQRLVMWTIDPGDFEPVRTALVIERVKRKLKRGSIILLHDNDQTKGKIAEILTRTIDTIQHFGMTILPLPL